jgi:2-dehydropantoate 2-reductase
MGGLFAYFLVKSGQSVVMLDIHPERVERIIKEGLRIEGISGSGRVPAEIILKPERVGEVNVVILCVKSYDTEKALQYVAPFLKPGTTIMTVQNGLGNVETIARIAGREYTIGGTTAHGATDLGLGRIRHAGRGETIIGSLSETSGERVREIARVFNQAGIETTITDDVEGTIWSKLLINAAINPLTAILHLRNGELLEYPETREIIRGAVEETVAVVKEKRITLKWDDPVAQTERVCQATANNYSSMLQDVLNHKRTEIDFINGAIVREGESVGIPTPINSTLTRLVKAVEGVEPKGRGVLLQ